VTDNAHLEIGNQGADLVGVRGPRCRLQIIWPDTQRPPIAGAIGVCAGIEGGHSGTRAAAPNRHLDSRCIESGCPQVRSLRIVIIVTIAVGEGAVTICAARVLPGLQSGLYIILRKARAAVQQEGKSECPCAAAASAA